jgi:hypothetical protein
MEIKYNEYGQPDDRNVKLVLLLRFLVKHTYELLLVDLIH